MAVREHNRIAQGLKAINQEWDGEKVFYETRKIVAAQHQHITYNEFLPEILDQSYIDRYGLKLEDKGFYTGYNSSIDPSIASSFAAASFRFGHSQIQDLMSRYGKKYQKKYAPFPTKDYFNPAQMYDVSHGGIDGLIRGLVKDHSQKVDGSFAKAVQQELIRGPGDLSDLAAINIQRGRERGLPGYNTFRSLCGLQKATSFDQFKTEIASAVVDKMADVYKHPDDVDLFVGGLLESHVGEGALGPTF
ncbi:hypothetical protein OS493_009494 [Desmophyllum pertusum]|uniref:Heme peroxidase n=1 Tax=Desmophyllum pertusum TaxID=174260 RepID=A0A9W9Z6A8_9CNID|nr:hypothetical protein OS493_009494 [Desmophyllum pertusum]